MLRCARAEFESVPEVPTAGFSEGGNDVDEYILSRLLEEGGAGDALHQRRGGFLVKLRQTRESVGRTHPEWTVAIDGAVLTVRRATVEACCREFIEKAVEALQRFLARCESTTGLRAPPVLLVGGGARLPGLQEAVARSTAGPVYLWNHSDYAAVLGAAEPLASVEKANRTTTSFGVPRERPADADTEPEEGSGQESTSHVLACSQCGQKVRVPKLASELLVTCPRCKHRFSSVSVSQDSPEIGASLIQFQGSSNCTSQVEHCIIRPAESGPAPSHPLEAGPPPSPPLEPEPLPPSNIEAIAGCIGWMAAALIPIFILVKLESKGLCLASGVFILFGWFVKAAVENGIKNAFGKKQ